MTSRWYGKVGFGVTKEVKKGIWKPTIEEREYYGEIISMRKSNEQQSYSTNEDIQINAKISIIEDDFISVNCATIRYVEFMGALWRVKELTPEHHRLVLTLGGVYNDSTDN